MISDFMASVVSVVNAATISIQPYVMRLVGILLAIDFTLWGIKIAQCENNSISAQIAKVMASGALVYVITNWGPLGVMLQNTLIEFGVIVANSGDQYLPSGVGSPGQWTAEFFTDPSEIVKFGREQLIIPMEEAHAQLIENMQGGPIQQLSMKVEFLPMKWSIGAVVSLAFFIVAVQLAVAQIEFWAVLLFSLIVVPFTLWKPLSFIGEKAFSAVVGQAIKLGIITATTGIVMNVLRSTMLTGFSDPTTYFSLEFRGSLLPTMILVVFVVLQVPALANTLLSGMPTLSANTLLASIRTMGQAAKSTGQRASAVGKAAQAGMKKAAPVVGHVASAMMRGASRMASQALGKGGGGGAMQSVGGAGSGGGSGGSGGSGGNGPGPSSSASGVNVRYPVAPKRSGASRSASSGPSGSAGKNVRG